MAKTVKQLRDEAAALQKQADELEVSERKDIADRHLKELADAGHTWEAVYAERIKKAVKASTRGATSDDGAPAAPRATASRSATHADKGLASDGSTPGQIYVDPKDPNKTWKGGRRGTKPPFILALRLNPDVEGDNTLDQEKLKALAKPPSTLADKVGEATE